MREPGTRRARGHSLLEVVVATALSVFLTTTALGAASRARSAYARVVDRIEEVEALRLTRYVIRNELRHGVAGRDRTIDADSIALRAFRGSAFVCVPDPAADRVVVQFTGDRLPDPAKDSVLWVRPDGASGVADLVAVQGGPETCRGVEGEVWRLDGPVPRDVVVGRLFERGSYHLAGGALRYRRGSSGRQPLTPDVWRRAEWVVAGRTVGFRLDDRRGASIRVGFLAWIESP